MENLLSPAILAKYEEYVLDCGRHWVKHGYASVELDEWSRALRRRYFEGTLPESSIKILKELGFIWDRTLSDSDLDYFGLVDGSVTYGWLVESEKVFIRDMRSLRLFEKVFGRVAIPKGYMCPSSKVLLYGRVWAYAGTLKSPSRSRYLLTVGSWGVCRSPVNLDRYEKVFIAYEDYVKTTGTLSVPKGLIWNGEKLGTRVENWRSQFARGILPRATVQVLQEKGILAQGYRYVDVTDAFKGQIEKYLKLAKAGANLAEPKYASTYQWERKVQKALQNLSLRKGELEALQSAGLVGSGLEWLGNQVRQEFSQKMVVSRVS